MKKKPISASRRSGAEATMQTDTAVRPARASTNGSRDNGRDTRESQQRQILTALVAFRDGDFSVRLPADWGGIDGSIADAFNQTIAQEDRIAREISRVSVMVGKEGRLKQRVALPAATGEWRANAQSINTLI